MGASMGVINASSASSGVWKTATRPKHKHEKGRLPVGWVITWIIAPMPGPQRIAPRASWPGTAC